MAMGAASPRSPARRQRRDMRAAQSRTMSLIEALANVAVGFAIAVLTQRAVFPLFGISTTLPTDLAIGTVFTLSVGGALLSHAAAVRADRSAALAALFAATSANAGQNGLWS